jgi:hypothetical protein
MLKFFLLDVVDASASKLIWWSFAIVIAVTVIVEMIVMLDAFIVNVASLAVGMILIEFISRVFNNLTIFNLIWLFLITLVVEGGLLYLLNRAKPFSRTALVTFIMNAATYALFILVFGKL